MGKLLYVAVLLLITSQVLTTCDTDAIEADAPEYALSARRDSPGAVEDWAKDAIFYQIFPERFRNGDLSNDKDWYIVSLRSVGMTTRVF